MCNSYMWTGKSIYDAVQLMEFTKFTRQMGMTSSLTGGYIFNQIYKVHNAGNILIMCGRYLIPLPQANTHIRDQGRPLPQE